MDILLEWLSPTPKCWQCYTEERDSYQNDSDDDKLDHQVITCVGYSKNGISKEIIFDWYGDTNHPGQNWSGGSPRPFRTKYPFVPPGPSQGLYEPPYWTGCNGDPFV